MDDATERRMNFIVEQLANHAVSIQQLDERMDRVERQIEAHDRQIEANIGMLRQLVDVSMSLANHIEEVNEHIRAVDERLGRRIDELVESQAHSDRRLDVLIDVVDKLVRHNGNAS